VPAPVRVPPPPAPAPPQKSQSQKKTQKRERDWNMQAATMQQCTDYADDVMDAVIAKWTKIEQNRVKPKN